MFQEQISSLLSGTLCVVIYIEKARFMNNVFSPEGCAQHVVYILYVPRRPLLEVESLSVQVVHTYMDMVANHS